MSLSLQISDYYELLALHRALMEAKFTPEPWDPIVPGSPYIAKIANQVVDMLTEIEDRQKPESNEEHNWRAWRKIDPTRREWQISLERARKLTKWTQWSFEHKKDMVTIFLSPFTVGENLIITFIEQAEANV